MESLRAYLRTLATDEQSAYAIAAGTTIGYLRKVLSTQGRIGAEICARLETSSGGAVRRWDLRPADWWLIWPELQGQEGAPPIPEAADAA